MALCIYFNQKCMDTELDERYSHDVVPNRTVCEKYGEMDNNRTQWQEPSSGITFDNVWIAYVALFQVFIHIRILCWSEYMLRNTNKFAQFI